MHRVYKSRAARAVHETATDFHEAGVMDKRTLREFDELRLTQMREMPPEDIRALREKEWVSQAVFARCLNVSTSLASQWERGKKQPGGAALKLLTPVREKGIDAIA